MTRIRLMKASGDHADATKVQHEFDTEQDLPQDTILRHREQLYVYNDAGDDENGPWEEWIPAEVIDVNFTVGPG